MDTACSARYRALLWAITKHLHQCAEHASLFLLLQLTGTLPEYLATLPLLTEVKVQENQLIGTIPEAFGKMKRGVRRFQVEHNHMYGRIPSSFK